MGRPGWAGTGRASWLGPGPGVLPLHSASPRSRPAPRTQDRTQPATHLLLSAHRPCQQTGRAEHRPSQPARCRQSAPPHTHTPHPTPPHPDPCAGARSAGAVLPLGHGQRGPSGGARQGRGGSGRRKQRRDSVSRPRRWSRGPFCRDTRSLPSQAIFSLTVTAASAIDAGPGQSRMFKGPSPGPGRPAVGLMARRPSADGEAQRGRARGRRAARRGRRAAGMAWRRRRGGGGPGMYGGRQDGGGSGHGGRRWRRQGGVQGPEAAACFRSVGGLRASTSCRAGAGLSANQASRAYKAFAGPGPRRTRARRRRFPPSRGGPCGPRGARGTRAIRCPRLRTARWRPSGGRWLAALSRAWRGDPGRARRVAPGTLTGSTVRRRTRTCGAVNGGLSDARSSLTDATAAATGHSSPSPHLESLALALG